jgi:hypothetical protein
MTLVGPPVPAGLCGERGCVYLAGHLDRGQLAHSWEVPLW